MKPIGLFLLLFYSCFALSAGPSPATVYAPQVEVLPGHWRFAFPLSNPVAIKSTHLVKPYRLVVDLPHATWRGPTKALLQSGSPLSDFRWAQGVDGRLRLVFESPKPLYGAVHLASPRGSPSFQLVVDLSTRPVSTVGITALSPPKKNILPTFSHPAVQITADSAVSRLQRNIIVVIDPGHGGKDPGTIGHHGVREKDVVLEMSRQLQSFINQQPGFKAYLTRTGDYFIPLRGRLAIARHYKADMFIAVHADSYPKADAEGVSVFALSLRGATSESARWLAQRENASELMGGISLNDKDALLKSVLLNLSQAATIQSSLEMGYHILRAVSQLTQLRHHRVEQAAFVVLKSPDIPSLLVETGFLSNSEEEWHLASRAYQTHIANALMQGICRYFKSNPPKGTWLAAWGKK